LKIALKPLDQQLEKHMNPINKLTRMRGLLVVAMFGGLASGAATLSSAAEQPPAPGTVVKYSDLNVSSTQGAATLYGRIRSAAASECAPVSHGDEASKLRMQACIYQTVQEAVSRANLPALSAVYAAKTGGKAPMLVAAQQ
jgi:UrcA family protein